MVVVSVLPPSGPNDGFRGSNSEFYPGSVSYPSTERIRAVGGGGGFKNPVPSYAPGGSGGGAGWNAPAPTISAGNTPTDPNHPQVQGYAGGGFIVILLTLVVEVVLEVLVNQAILMHQDIVRVVLDFSV